MTTIEPRHTSPTKRTKPTASGKVAEPKLTGKPSSAHGAPSKAVIGPSRTLAAANRVLSVIPDEYELVTVVEPRGRTRAIGNVPFHVLGVGCQGF